MPALTLLLSLHLLKCLSRFVLVKKPIDRFMLVKVSTQQDRRHTATTMAAAGSKDLGPARKLVGYAGKPPHAAWPNGVNGQDVCVWHVWCIVFASHHALVDLSSLWPCLCRLQWRCSL